MAKCILMRDGQYAGKIVRVPDDYARELIASDRAEYKPKTDWKSEGLKERLQPKGRV